jgi:hypothetical protein
LSAAGVVPARPEATARAARTVLVVALLAAAGLLVAAVSFRWARESVRLDGARGLLWLALGLIYLPAITAVLRRDRPRSERVAVLLIAGVSLYALKVLYDPSRLGFPDELIHAANASRLIGDGQLYQANSISPVSADFPGLSSIAAGIAVLFHVGVVPAGLVTIGLARVVLTLALFLLFEQVADGDSRLAGVATLLFCANPNYLYWSSQFSYESLSLPLFVLVLFCVSRRWSAPAADRRLWTLATLPLIALIVVTHHVTGMALAVTLWVLVAIGRRRGERGAAPVALAAVVTVAVAAWLVAVAPDTFSYLGDIFRRAGQSIGDAFSSSGATHRPFEGGGATAPLDDKALAALSALLAVAASVLGVREARRRTWRSPLFPLLMLAALASIVVYGLRIFPDAWETANRASEYVYLGVALMAAMVVVRLVDGRARVLPGVVVVGALVAVTGSSVSGWPASAQLPRPFRVDRAGAVVVPQGESAAAWSVATAPDARYVADDSTGRLLMTHGARHVLSSRHPGVPELLKDATLPAWEQTFLRDQRIDRLVIDDRKLSNDNVIGYFFARPGQRITRYPPGARTKIQNLPGVSKVYDSGDTVIYDISGWRTGAAR